MTRVLITARNAVRSAIECAGYVVDVASMKVGKSRAASREIYRGD